MCVRYEAQLYLVARHEQTTRPRSSTRASTLITSALGAGGAWRTALEGRGGTDTPWSRWVQAFEPAASGRASCGGPGRRWRNHRLEQPTFDMMDSKCRGAPPDCGSRSRGAAGSRITGNFPSWPWPWRRIHPDHDSKVRAPSTLNRDRPEYHREWDKDLRKRVGSNASGTANRVGVS